MVDGTQVGYIHLAVHTFLSNPICNHNLTVACTSTFFSSDVLSSTPFSRRQWHERDCPSRRLLCQLRRQRRWPITCRLRALRKYQPGRHFERQLDHQLKWKKVAFGLGQLLNCSSHTLRRTNTSFLARNGLIRSQMLS